AANRDIACDTEFRVGSISKTFVALALLKLEEEGRINLYARLQDVAPEIPMKNRWGNTNPVRIVNLLEHSAGFDDMEFAEVYNRHDRADYPLLDVFKRFQEPENVRWPAGTRFAYSNPGYGIAGHVIEKVTGQPFDAYIQQRILAPLEITVGDFRFTDANRAALGYSLANYMTSDSGCSTSRHDGGVDGFICSHLYVPEQNWGYVVLLNSTVSGKALEDLNQLAIDFLSKDFPMPQQPVISLATK